MEKIEVYYEELDLLHDRLAYLELYFLLYYLNMLIIIR